MKQEQTVAVIGGGAAGFFTAIACAEQRPDLRVLILEKTSQVLGKVKISGGGRCNVTHACFEPRELIKRYPRGERTLTGPFHHWSPTETIEWFESRGVPLKTEADGRMFPTTDSSQTIIDCLTKAARAAGVEVRLKAEVIAVESTSDGYVISLKDGDALKVDALVVASGGIRNATGQRIGEYFGHTVKSAAPSLFTFKVDDERLRGLSGISVPDVRVRIPGTRLSDQGPVLITHWGLSGPGILRISAWGARELAERNYQFEVVLNWTGQSDLDGVREQLEALRKTDSRKRVTSTNRFEIPQRFWQKLTAAAGISDEIRWAHLPAEAMKMLWQQLTECKLPVNGKSMNKDEFVTCGGIHLKEVNFRTLESKLQPRLYFVGEVLDVDGITGGFNFQAAWTTGHLAGTAIAEALV